MLSDFICDLTRKIKYEYRVDGELREKIFEVKGLSIRTLANIFSHPVHGVVLLQIVDGIKLESSNEKEIKDAVVQLIDTKYADLVYHVVASCVYVENEKGEMASCENDYLLFDKLPLDLVIKLLYNVVELTLPEKEFELKTEIKKLMELLTK